MQKTSDAQLNTNDPFHVTENLAEAPQVPIQCQVMKADEVGVSFVVRFEMKQKWVEVVCVCMPW